MNPSSPRTSKLACLLNKHLYHILSISRNCVETISYPVQGFENEKQAPPPFAKNFMQPVNVLYRANQLLFSNTLVGSVLLSIHNQYILQDLFWFLYTEFHLHSNKNFHISTPHVKKVKQVMISRISLNYVKIFKYLNDSNYRRKLVQTVLSNYPIVLYNSVCEAFSMSFIHSRHLFTGTWKLKVGQIINRLLLGVDWKMPENFGNAQVERCISVGPPNLSLLVPKKHTKLENMEQRVEELVAEKEENMDHILEIPQVALDTGNNSDPVTLIVKNYDQIDRAALKIKKRNGKQELLPVLFGSTSVREKQWYEVGSNRRIERRGEPSVVKTRQYRVNQSSELVKKYVEASCSRNKSR